nr:unnamed protein product [Callosobruchus analis]
MVSKTINDVADRIFAKAHGWIKFPSDLEGSMEKARSKWSKRFQIPTVIGVLDCTRVQIGKPSDFGDEFINRKGFSSIYIYVTCDVSEVITSVDAQWPRSACRIWKRSSIYKL